MKTLAELDKYLRKHFKINDKIKTVYVNHSYSKDGIIELLVGMCYTYHNKRSLVVVPTYTPNFETKRMEADLDKLEYKKFWVEDDSCTKAEFENSIRDLLNNKGIPLNG